MVDEHGVPADMETLVAQYEPFIKWAIHRYTRRPLSPPEVEDARQQVYERMLRYDYLSRCREYYATHPGRFTTSLSTLIRNLLTSRVKADPLAGAISLDARQPGGKRVLPERIERDSKADRAAAKLEAKIRVDQVTTRLRRLLPTQGKVIDQMVAESKIPGGLSEWRREQLQHAARSVEKPR